MATTAPTQDYRIGPLDVLRVSVFGEEDLSFEEITVSLGGGLSLPLAGNVPATGQTASDLAAEVARRLNERYLRDAQVSISVVRPVNYTVTVDGEVRRPGVYPIPGRLMLSQALALGEGATEYAKLNELLVIREVSGQRYVARFDLTAIRTGQANDLEIQQGDVVVVGFDRGSRLIRDLITALPGAAGIFVAVNQ